MVDRMGSSFFVKYASGMQPVVTHSLCSIIQKEMKVPYKIKCSNILNF